MKKVQLLSLVVLMVLGSTQSFARSIQQEIDQEADLAMKSTAKTSFNRPVAQSSLISLVPIGGMTFSNFKTTGNSSAYSFATTSGYDAGVGVLIGRGDLQFETGVMYAERGSKESYKFNFTSWDLTYTNKYLELPVLARYNIVNNKDMRFYVKGGALMAILQDSKGNLSNAQNYNNPNMYSGAYSYYGVNTYNSSLANDNSTKSAFGATDLRWVLGLGGQIRITRWLAWTIEGDYQNSTSPISTSQPDGLYSTTGFNLSMETYGLRTGIVIGI
jgi:hypothetical protein